jgi:hypothetical protein
MSRPLLEIDNEITATAARLNELKVERDRAVKARNRAILADFDEGLAPGEIAEKRGLNKFTVFTILWKAGRKVRERVVPISHLPANIQRDYRKFRQCGMGRAAARSAALNLTGGAL